MSIDHPGKPQTGNHLWVWFIGLPLGIAVVIASALFGYGYYTHHQAEVLAVQAMKDEQERIARKQEEIRAKLEQEAVDLKRRQQEADLERQRREQEYAQENQRRERDAALDRQRIQSQTELEKRENERRAQDLERQKLDLAKQESVARREQDARDATLRERMREDERAKYEAEADKQRLTEAIQTYADRKLTAYKRLQIVSIGKPIPALSRKKNNEKQVDGLLYHVRLKGRFVSTGLTVTPELYFFLVNDEVVSTQLYTDKADRITICELKKKN